MNKRGQTTIEYALVAVIIVLGIILAFKQAAVNEAIGNAANNIQNSLLVDE
jgi:Flp pilus assembly pilin Flp